MTPDKWGPPYWNYLHTLGKILDGQRQSNTKKKETIQQFLHTIPCPICEKFAQEHFNRHFLRYKSAYTYTRDLHDAVNKKLHKKGPQTKATNIENVSTEETTRETKKQKTRLESTVFITSSVFNGIFVLFFLYLVYRYYFRNRKQN